LLDGHNLSKDSKIQVQLETEILDALAV
jgi:hypothetical protein